MSLLAGTGHHKKWVVGDDNRSQMFAAQARKEVITMEIDLGNNIYLRSDTRCFILSEKKPKETPKKGESWYFEDIGYYYTLPEVFKAVLKRQIRLIDAYTLEELAAAFEQISAHLESKIEEAVAACAEGSGLGLHKRTS